MHRTRARRICEIGEGAVAFVVWWRRRSPDVSIAIVHINIGSTWDGGIGAHWEIMPKKRTALSGEGA